MKKLSELVPFLTQKAHPTFPHLGKIENLNGKNNAK